MILELMAMLDALQGEVVFFVEDGPLKNTLIERYLEEDEAHADILECELDASVRIQWVEGSAAPVFACLLETGDFQYQTILAVGDLTNAEITDLVGQLRRHCPIPLPKQTRPCRNILRKKKGHGLLNISEASKGLGLSPRSLKTLIPCSEIRIAETDGEKTIEEYYWEKDLIGRLESLWEGHKQGRGHHREDESYIAEWCCDGDMLWAKDIISEFLQQRSLCGD